MPGLDRGKIEDVADHGQERFTGFVDVPDHRQWSGRQRLPGQQFGQAEDGVQRGAQFMAHVGEELALGGARGRQLEGALPDLLFQQDILILQTVARGP